MCEGASGMKMVAWGIFASAPGRDEPIRRGNGPLSPTFIGQDGLRTYQRNYVLNITDRPGKKG